MESSNIKWWCPGIQKQIGRLWRFLDFHIQFQFFRLPYSSKKGNLMLKILQKKMQMGGMCTCSLENRTFSNMSASIRNLFTVVTWSFITIQCHRHSKRFFFCSNWWLNKLFIFIYWLRAWKRATAMGIDCSPFSLHKKSILYSW